MGWRRRALPRAGVALLLVVTLVVSGAGVVLLRPSPAPTTSGRPPTGIRVAQPSQGVTDLSGWYRLPIPGASPSNRTAGQMTYDSETGYVLLFGGCPSYAPLAVCDTYLGDSWDFLHGEWTRLAPTVSPPARAAGVIADDPSDGVVVLFGGRDASGLLNDTWTFSAGQWTELHPAHHPPALEFAAMAYDSVDGDLILFGGLPSKGDNGSSQTWSFQGGDWTNLTSGLQPPGWVAPYLAPDSNDGQLVLYGGVRNVSAGSTEESTWLFLNGTWKNLTTPLYVGPPTRLWGLAGFDPELGYTLLFGGGGAGGVYDDLWELSPSNTWDELWGAGDPPGAFYETQATWDEADGYTVEFTREDLGSIGGVGEIVAVTNETWALLTLLNVGVGVAYPTVQVDRPLVFQANVTGGLGPYRYAWDLGDGANSTGASFTHIYNRTGTYTVLLNVTDSVGQISDAVVEIVNVTAGPAPPPSLTFDSYALIAAEAAVATAAVVGVLYRRHRGRRDAPRTSGGAMPVGRSSPVDDPLPGPPRR